MENFGIGDLARESGCAVQTVRHYEAIGLLQRAARTAGNQRRYGGEALRRLRFIRHARTLGFELDDVREFLRLASHSDSPCADADLLVQRHLATVEERIAQLTRLRGELKRMAGACRGGNIAECRVIEILTDHDLCASEHVAPPALPRRKRRA